MCRNRFQTNHFQKKLVRVRRGSRSKWRTSDSSAQCWTAQGWSVRIAVRVRSGPVLRGSEWAEWFARGLRRCRVRTVQLDTVQRSRSRQPPLAARRSSASDRTSTDRQVRPTCRTRGVERKEQDSKNSEIFEHFSSAQINSTLSPTLASGEDPVLEWSSASDSSCSMRPSTGSKITESETEGGVRGTQETEISDSSFTPSFARRMRFSRCNASVSSYNSYILHLFSYLTMYTYVRQRGRYFRSSIVLLGGLRPPKARPGQKFR